MGRTSIYPSVWEKIKEDEEKEDKRKLDELWEFYLAIQKKALDSSIEAISKKNEDLYTSPLDSFPMPKAIPNTHIPKEHPVGNEG